MPDNHKGMRGFLHVLKPTGNVFDVKSSNDEHTITYLETQQGDLTLAIYSYILLGLNTTSVASTGWKGTGSVSKAVLFMLDRLKKSVCPRKGLSDNQNCFI